MAIETFISTYGYPAILAGTFLEGETILVLAGFASHRGYLHLPGVIMAAFLGSLLGDQLAFHLGRRHGQRVLARKPEWRHRMERVDSLTKRYRSWIILCFRFLYGMRNIIPFTLGMGDVAPGRFMALNALGALLWATAVGCGGYLFGHAMEILLGDLKRYEVKLMAVLVVSGLLIWLFRHARLRRTRRSSPR